MNVRIWTFSNFLSVLRILLLLPVSYLLIREQSGDQVMIIILLIVMVMTDFFDGFFARTFQQVSDAGKILDPLADKIGIIVVCSILVSKGRMPVWFFIIALARDIIILLGGMYLKKVNGVIPQSNMIGKWTVTVIAVYILLIVIDASALYEIQRVVMAASVAMIVLSFSLYAKRFTEVLK